MRSVSRVVAVASGGGHWVQLFRLRLAWDECSVTYVTTDNDLREEVLADAYARGQALPDFRVICEANRWHKLRLLKQLAQLSLIILTLRPDAVITTGAAPGYFAIRIGRLVGARTAWVDSIANVEEMSLSGARAGRHADLWLTQWPELVRPNGPEYRGAVL